MNKSENHSLMKKSWKIWYLFVFIIAKVKIVLWLTANDRTSSGWPLFVQFHWFCWLIDCCDWLRLVRLCAWSRFWSSSSSIRMRPAASGHNLIETGIIFAHSVLIVLALPQAEQLSLCISFRKSVSIGPPPGTCYKKRDKSLRRSESNSDRRNTTIPLAPPP